MQGDPLGVAEALRGTPVGRNTVTNYRGLPAVSYHDMSDFDLQQEVCAKAGITGRIISNSVRRRGDDRGVQKARDRRGQARQRPDRRDRGAVAASNWGLGTLNPLDASHIAEGERCLGALGFKGLLISSSWHGRFIDGEDAFPFWEWAQDPQVPIFIHPPRVPIGHERRWISSSSTSWWAGRSTPPWRWRA